MQQGEQTFGVSNLEYDIVTTLSNLLQAEEVLTKYAADAQRAGEQEVAQIFQKIQENNREAASQLREKLAKTMTSA